MVHAYRTAVVTGATSGIGRAIVPVLHSQGLRVYTIGRDQSKLAELHNSIGVIPIEADVRDTARVATALAGIEVDVLVSNAGVLSTRDLFQTMDPAAIDTMVDVNFRAPLHLIHTVLPGMVLRNRGHIIHVGSSSGIAPYPNMSVYGATKAGLSLFCDNLRCDLLGTSVRVSEIAPGRVQTDLYRTALTAGGAQELLYNGYRTLQPDDVARVIGDMIALPLHVNVARVEVFPTDQAKGVGSMVRV